MGEFHKVIADLERRPIKIGASRLGDERAEYEDSIATLEQENAKLKDIIEKQEHIYGSLEQELSALQKAYDNQSKVIADLEFDSAWLSELRAAAAFNLDCQSAIDDIDGYPGPPSLDEWIIIDNCGMKRFKGIVDDRYSEFNSTIRQAESTLRDLLKTVRQDNLK